MKIIIIASDCHSGGGMVMLKELLNSAKKMKSIDYHIMVDPRFNSESYLSTNIFFTPIKKSQRIFYVNKKVGKLVGENDIIINISGLPTFKRYKATMIQYLMNRFFVENYSMKGLPLPVKLRLSLQRLAFNIFLKKADYIFVHNLVMKDCILRLGYRDNIINIVPYKDLDISSIGGQRLKDSFIYVASGEVYKNHQNLLLAWIELAEQGFYPTLFLTINNNTRLYETIKIKSQQYKLKIIVKSDLRRDELLAYYKKVSALIYPSFFECFGIPLVEAKNYNLPIIASELDYVRDLVDPTETFDPNSPRSIARAVKRFVGESENRVKIQTADEFTKELISYAKT